MAQETRTFMTANDYFEHPEYANHDLVELINGEVIIRMPPILKHQLIVKKIIYLLAKFEETQGGLAFMSPTEVRFDAQNVFEPDVLYITPDNLAIAQQDEKRIVGVPNLIVEVLSPSTARYDRQQKYQVYEKHGVQEYWIVDPVHETIEVWTQSEGKSFARLGAFGADEVFKSVVLNEDVTTQSIFGRK